MSNQVRPLSYRDQVMVDRGATLLLAATEVGPHINKLTAHTKIPYYVVANASWYLRRAGIWNNNRSGRKYRYDWEQALQLGDGEGLMRDAAVAAGFVDLRRSGGYRIYEPNQRPRRIDGSYNLRAGVPACLTALGLARHRMLEQYCEPCESAAVERQTKYLARQATLKSSVLERRQAEEQRLTQESLAWERYQEFQNEERLLEQNKRVAGLREYHNFRAAGLTLPRPRETRLNATFGDRFDFMNSSDTVSAFGTRHHTEWVDPTFDAVTQLLEDQEDRLAVAYGYKPLLPLGFSDSDEAEFWIDTDDLERRVGFTLVEN